MFAINEREVSMEESICKNYLKILEEELLPAMGCTEPIAVAYASALARDVLNASPVKAEISVSGNILKNVKSVVVPNTGGLRGIASAVSAGVVAGKSEKKLEVLSEIGQEDIAEIEKFLNECEFKIEKSKSGEIFDIAVRLFSENDESFARIVGYHTNVVRVEHNGEVLFDSEGRCNEFSSYVEQAECADRSTLCVKNIVEFIQIVDVKDLEDTVGKQIEHNVAIGQEGLKNDYGASVGKILLSAFGNDVHTMAKALAAAGSDARMNGCNLPVVIVSGSGNQGMVASLPVVVYAEHLGVDRENLLRAVALSDLITIHLKSGIGRLSAYCGAVSAGCGAGAGICYLYGGDAEQIAQTISNVLAIDSGIICDGAKSSCAAKIASAVEAGLVGMEMSRNGKKFHSGDGILEKNVESTIENIGDIARNGMRETDEEIIRLMIKNCN